jgi:hypothetical protein
MSKDDWNSPEALAFFQNEYDHAIKNAKATLAKACAQGGVLEQMGELPHALTGALRDHLGDAFYYSLEDLIIAVPMVREFLDAGETGKL